MKNNPSKLWTPGQTLKIAFLNGTQAFKDATISAAETWLPHINLTFDFVDGTEGDIRILSEEGTFFSYVGSDALLLAEGPTMRLWPHPESHARYFAANVMHEFGHMLGAEHEQTHPEATIPWDRPALYAHFDLPEDPEEDSYQDSVMRERLHHLYLDRATPGESSYSDYDRKSIMHYVIQQSWTEGDFVNYLNLTLSDQDKAFMAKAYPHP